MIRQWADCQTLAEDYSLTANDYYLTGCVALAMDSYDEASSNFSKAYGDEATYEMAIQIYEAYLGHDMEADGTKYLEASLKTEAKTAEVTVSEVKSIIIWKTMIMPEQN